MIADPVLVIEFPCTIRVFSSGLWHVQDKRGNHAIGLTVNEALRTLKDFARETVYPESKL
jgi:hypothetical protein